MKILIIDDEELKLIYFRDQCNNIFDNPEVVMCSSLSSAKGYLSTFFDIVLCDLRLGNEYSEPFVISYKVQWQKSYVVLYSGSIDKCEDVHGMKVWSSVCVIQCLEDYRKQKKIAKKQNTEIKHITITGKDEIGAVKTYVQIIGIAFTILGLAVTVGVTKNIIDTAQIRINALEAKTTKTDDAIKDLLITSASLKITIEQLNKTCDELKQEIRRVK